MSARFEVDVAKKYRRRRNRTARRFVARAAETAPPHGQAALWFEEMSLHVSPSGIRVGKQIARLCGSDSLVQTTYRSLADAVGHRDKIGRTRAHTERGVQVLVESGWLKVVTVGQKRGAKTTFYLMPGPAVDYVEPSAGSTSWHEEHAA